MSEPVTLYKLIILYMLGKVDFPLTNSQISSFILGEEYTTFFTLQTMLAELEDNQMIRSETIGNSTYYHITEAGDEALKYFYNRIPAAIREDINRYMSENKIQMHDDVSVLSDYYKNTGGDFSAHCIVKEKFSNPIELTICVPDEEDAKNVCANWPNHCQNIYEFVMKELL